MERSLGTSRHFVLALLLAVVAAVLLSASGGAAFMAASPAALAGALKQQGNAAASTAIQQGRSALGSLASAASAAALPTPPAQPTPPPAPAPAPAQPTTNAAPPVTTTATGTGGTTTGNSPLTAAQYKERSGAALGALGAVGNAVNSIDTDVTENTSACWLKSYGRGAGKPLAKHCAAGLEKNGALCYPKCKDGYKGVGPVCWQRCAKGWTNTGLTCHVPLKVVKADTSRCPWYDKCCLSKKNKSKRGRCPDGFTNDGCTCRRAPKSSKKKSYGRGVGQPLSCKEGWERNALLCYPKCRAGFKGKGPVCWAQCPAHLPHKCGVLCVADKRLCTSQVMKFAQQGASAVVSFVTAGVAVGATVASGGTTAAATVPAAIGGVVGGAASTANLGLGLGKVGVCKANGKYGQQQQPQQQQQSPDQVSAFDRLAQMQPAGNSKQALHNFATNMRAALDYLERDIAQMPN